MFDAKPIKTYKNKKEERGLWQDYVRKHVLIGVVHTTPYMGLTPLEPTDDFFPTQAAKDVQIDIKNLNGRNLEDGEVWLVSIQSWHCTIGKVYKGKEIVHLDGELLHPVTDKDKQACLWVDLVNEELDEAEMLEKAKLAERHSAPRRQRDDKKFQRGAIPKETTWGANKYLEWEDANGKGIGYVLAKKDKDAFNDVLPGQEKVLRLNITNPGVVVPKIGEFVLCGPCEWSHEEGKVDARERAVVIIRAELLRTVAAPIRERRSPTPRRSVERPVNNPVFANIVTPEELEALQVTITGRRKHDVKKNYERGSDTDNLSKYDKIAFKQKKQNLRFLDDE